MDYMDWMEQIKATLRWLKDNPSVTWSGIGTTLLVAVCSWFYARLRKPQDTSIRHIPLAASHASAGAAPVSGTYRGTGVSAAMDFAIEMTWETGCEQYQRLD